MSLQKDVYLGPSEPPPPDPKGMCNDARLYGTWESSHCKPCRRRQQAMSNQLASEPNLMVKSAKINGPSKSIPGVRAPAVPTRVESVTRAYPDYLTVTD